MTQARYYPDETKLVNYLTDQIAVRAELSREEAWAILLRTYLTGDSTRMSEIFGERVWVRLAKCSQRRHAKAILEE